MERTVPPPAVYMADDYVRDYIHSQDVARVVASAVGGEQLAVPALNLGTGVGTSNRELASLVDPRSFVEATESLGPSHSVADMTLARATLRLPEFTRLADAIAAWTPTWP
jgi:nucleoside-diphosphate-sugar epimerase